MLQSGCTWISYMFFYMEKKNPLEGSFLLILEFPNKTKNSLHRLDMQHGLRKGGGGVTFPLSQVGLYYVISETDEWAPT